MLKSDDSSSVLSGEHYDSIQNDLLRKDFGRSGLSDQLSGKFSDHTSELASLREFNSQLLERIGEFRKQNLALSTAESTLRSSLAAQEKRCSDLERKLAKLTDEKWEKSLEVEELSKQEVAHRDEIERLRQENQQSRDEIEKKYQNHVEMLLSENSEIRVRLEGATAENTRLSERLAGSERLNSEQAARIDEATQLLTGMEQEIENGRKELQNSKDAATRALTAAHEHQAQLSAKIHALTNREAQLINAFESLRAEYSSMDACYKEASATVVRLRGDLEAQARALSDAQRDVEALTVERARLQQLLEVKENRDETERMKLQTTREQLDFLDRHLRQVSETLKKDKSELLRISKQIADELQTAKQHPFREHLEAAEAELTHLQNQFNSMSPMSPNRLKLEVRIAQATEHRDLLKSAMANSERQLEERFQTVQSIIRSASV